MTTTKCRACGLLLEAGETLRVTPRNGAEPYAVHRPSLGARCLATADPGGRATIALADPAAADDFDRRSVA